jgi:hypothetical protein
VQKVNNRATDLINTAATKQLNRAAPRLFVLRCFHRMGRREVSSPAPAVLPGSERGRVLQEPEKFNKEEL